MCKAGGAACPAPANRLLHSQVPTTQPHPPRPAHPCCRTSAPNNPHLALPRHLSSLPLTETGMDGNSLTVATYFFGLGHITPTSSSPSLATSP